MKVEVKCRVCKEPHIIEMTEKQYGDWQDGCHVQYVFPELSADNRELLISGMCGKCFDKICKEE